MRRFGMGILLLAAVVAAPLTRAAVEAQTAPLLRNAPVTHLGIVTADIKTVAAGYADIFGIPLPEVKTISIDLINGERAEMKVAYVPMPNFYLEILEPVTKSGSVYDHLQKFGLGIHHMGVGLDANIDAVREELLSKGGTWTGGTKGGRYAFVDFRSTPLGVTLEVGPTARPAMPAAPTTQTGLFGARPVSHVGFANTDAEASMKKIVEVFGMAPVAPRRFPPEGPFPYPPNMWTANGSVQTAMVRQGDIGLEVIQGVGEPNPWSHHIKMQKGVSAMHIAVGRGGISRADWLRIGQEKGGKWTNGGPPPEGSFAYLDWSETLGLVIE